MKKKDQLDLDFGFESDDDLYGEEQLAEEPSRFRMKKKVRRKHSRKIAAIASFFAVVLMLIFGFNNQEDSANPTNPEEVETPSPEMSHDDGQAISDDANQNDEADEVTNAEEIGSDVDQEFVDEDTVEEEPASAEEQQLIKHEVVQGDSLYEISLQYYESPEYSKFLAAYNHFSDDQSLRVGQIIEVPYPPSQEYYGDNSQGSSNDTNEAVYHEVQNGETLYSISLRYFDTPQYQDLIAEHNEIEDASKLKVGDQLAIPPRPSEE